MAKPADKPDKPDKPGKPPPEENTVIEVTDAVLTGTMTDPAFTGEIVDHRFTGTLSYASPPKLRT
jgi:hypothetical protein